MAYDKTYEYVVKKARANESYRSRQMRVRMDYWQSMQEIKVVIAEYLERVHYLTPEDAENAACFIVNAMWVKR